MFSLRSRLRLGTTHGAARLIYKLPPPALLTPSVSSDGRAVRVSVAPTSGFALGGVMPYSGENFKFWDFFHTPQPSVTRRRPCPPL